MTKRDNDREQTHREYCLVNQFDKKNLTQYLAMCAQSKTIREFQNAFHLNFFLLRFLLDVERTIQAAASNAKYILNDTLIHLDKLANRTEPKRSEMNLKCAIPPTSSSVSCKHDVVQKIEREMIMLIK